MHERMAQFVRRREAKNVKAVLPRYFDVLILAVDHRRYLEPISAYREFSE
jgi:uncharacterized protein YcbK (DUF882 family)